VKVDPRAIKPKRTTKIDSLPATTAIWQAVRSGPMTLLPLDPQVCRSVGLPAHWSSAPGKNRKPFSLCSLMRLKSFSRTVQDALVHHGCHFGHVVHTFCNIQTVEVARAPGVNRRRSAHKTATHISVDLVIVLFRVDVTCHTSRVTVTRHNVCCI